MFACEGVLRDDGIGGVVGALEYFRSGFFFFGVSSRGVGRQIVIGFLLRQGLIEFIPKGGSCLLELVVWGLPGRFVTP